MTVLRLRVVFAALAIALAIPGALLVRRALASVALEREARERAVAERAFDEMERALTELLREEEARPASDYDFASGLSPLQERPEGELAFGWFQIEADGRVSAPTWAQRASALGAEIAADGARFEATGRHSAAAEKKAPPTARTKPEPSRRRAANDAPAPAPARATAKDVAPPATQPEIAPVRVGGVGEPGTLTPNVAIESDAGRSAESTDAYAALSKLNTGAREREQRKQRVYVEEQAVAADAMRAMPSASRSAASPSETAAPSALADEARARSEQIVAQAMSAPPIRSEWGQVTGESGAAAGRASAGDAADPSIEGKPEASAPAALSAPAEAPERVAREPATPAAPARARVDAARDEERPRSELVRVVVDPMRGRLAKGGELVLVRSAWIGDRGVRQGVGLDVAALSRALASAAQGDGALPGASVRVSATAARGSEPAAASERRAFTHRFAEPFDALTAELSFAPFADDGARTVHWLAALFTLAGAGGLFAIYRMTAVALHFAERRSNFAAAVSHELKTPLTAIRLYAEMLRDGLVSGEEKRREYYGSITAETERLSRLINNVLEFSRLEKGTRSLEPAVGDIGPVVREAVELLRPHAAAHGLALELALDGALPPVHFERDALLQVVFNLVDNAVKYGRGEPAKIEVACRRAGDGVALVVRDHGKGVPREELSRILEPFYRRGDELTRSAPGAGIGLALVRSLALQMGAALDVANAEGGGLAVTLALPGGAAASPPR